MSAREIVALLFREGRYVLLAFALPVAASLALFALTPKQYEAFAQILVGSSEGPAPSGAPLATTQEVLNSEVELLKARGLADRTIAAVGAERLFPALAHGRRTAQQADAVTAAFVSALTVQPVAQSRVIDLRFLGPSPAVATETLRRYLDFYLDRRQLSSALSTSERIRGQVRTSEAQLRDVDQRIAAARRRTGVYDVELERKNLLDAKSGLYLSSLQLQAQADEAASRAGALTTLRNQTPEQISQFSSADESDAMQRARAQLLELKQQQTKLGANYQPTSRPVLDLQAQIDTVQAFLTTEASRFASHVKPSRNPLYDNLAAESAKAASEVAPDQRRASDVLAQIDGVERRLSDLSAAEEELQPLLRERAQVSGVLDLARQRLVEAAVSDSVDAQKSASVQVIQKPTPSTLTHATKPKLTRFVLGGVLAGVLLAALLVGVAFARNNTFLVPEAVEARTKVPVLVSLPLRE